MSIRIALDSHAELAGMGSVAASHTVLQKVLLPDESRADRLCLYARWPRGGIHLADADGAMRVVVGKEVDFSTYFNAFTHRKWRWETNVSNAFFRIRGRGRVRVTLTAYNDTGAAMPVVERTLTLGEEMAELRLPSFTKLPGILVGATVAALKGDAIITGADWTTQSKPKRDVRLAAVITTFKREEAAADAIRKFRETIIPACAAGSLHLFVIDNGQSLQDPKLDGVTVLPNRNLGGAGGFTRGLLEAKKAGGFTHVLFMDDDASCEPESVWRTMALASYLTDAKSAVAGSMLLNDRPTVQHEKGAILLPWGGEHAVVHGVNHRWELSDPWVVANNEGPDIANYGGWWFFAFPIAAVKKLPFPFFVRGDDTDFSMTNKLRIVTMNGICSWCDDFAYKLTPGVEYLATRSWIALSLMHGDLRGARQTIRRFLQNAFAMGLRYDYAAMNAVLDAVEHVLKGPGFFGENPAPVAQLKEAGSRKQVEELSPRDFRLLAPRPFRQGLKRLMSKITLGGHIGPHKLRRELPHSAIVWEMPKWSLYRFPRVAYGKGEKVEVFTRNKEAMLSSFSRLLRLKIEIFWKLRSLRRLYRNQSDVYRNEDYWKDVLDKNN